MALSKVKVSLLEMLEIVRFQNNQEKHQQKQFLHIYLLNMQYKNICNGVKNGTAAESTHFILCKCYSMLLLYRNVLLTVSER